MLTETVKKIKEFLGSTGDLPKDIFLALLLVFVGFGGFLIGRISVILDGTQGGLRITEKEIRGAGLDAVQASVLGAAAVSSENVASGAGETVAALQSGAYVASRNGTVFHLPTCSGAKRISEANKIWFATKEEAMAKGYRPAANCKGL